MKAWWLCHQPVWYRLCFRECKFLTFPALWVALWVEINTEEFEYMPELHACCVFPGQVWHSLLKKSFLNENFCIFSFKWGNMKIFWKQQFPGVSAVLILAQLEMSSKKHTSSLQKCFHWRLFLKEGEDSRRSIFCPNQFVPRLLSFRGRPEGNAWLEQACILYIFDQGTVVQLYQINVYKLYLFKILYGDLNKVSFLLYEVWFFWLMPHRNDLYAKSGN